MLSADDCAFNHRCGGSGLCELIDTFDYGYGAVDLCNTTGQRFCVKQHDFHSNIHTSHVSRLCMTWYSYAGDCPVPGYCDSNYRCDASYFPQGMGGCYSDGRHITTQAFAASCFNVVTAVAVSSFSTVLT